MTDSAQDVLREVRPLVDYLASSFRDIPEGLSPEFYHTLSYEGDVAEGEKLETLLGRIDRVLEHEG